MPGYLSLAVKLCAFAALLTLLTLAAAGCGDSDDEMTPMPATPPPTSTLVHPTPAPPADTPTPTPLPLTSTPLPPTSTPLPSTSTPIPPTYTPTPTPMPPTPTPVPPTYTPTPPPAVPTPPPQPTSTPEVARGGELDPALILLESSKAMREVESFHFVMQATLSADQGPLSIELPMTSEGDFQRPDRSRASMDIDLGLFKIETEVIAIGDETYMIDLESGQWIKSDGGSDLMILDPVDLTDPGEFTNSDDFAELDDLRIIGQEAIEGIDTHHLAFSMSDWESDEGEPLSGDIEMHMWVGVDDYYLYKVALDGRFSLAQDETTQSGGSLIAGLGSDGDIDLDAVVNLSNFNVPVLIQPPEDFRTELSTPPAGQDAAPVQATELDSGWMRFDLPTKGISISAPPTWLLVPLDVEAARDMIERTSADVEGLADLIESFGDEVNYTLLAVELDDDGEFTSSFNVVTEAVDPAIDLGVLADLSIQQIKLLLPGVGEVISQTVDLPAGTAYRIGYTVSTPGSADDAEVAIVQYLLLHNSESIVVSFSTPAASIDAKSQVFQDIMDTLQLYDPGSPPSRLANKTTE